MSNKNWVKFAAVLGLALAVAGTALAASPILTDMLSYWRLDTDGGNTLGASALIPVGVVSWTAGKLGGAVQLDGTNYLSGGDVAGFRLGSGVTVTIAAWVYIDDSDNIFPIVVKGSIDNLPEYVLFYDHGVSGIGFTAANCSESGGYCNWAVWPGGVSAGAWYFVVGTFSESGACVSVNGSSYACDYFALPVTRSDYSSGLNVGSDETYFSAGRIDALGFWRRGLTQAEVTLLYNGGAGMEYPFCTPAICPCSDSYTGVIDLPAAQCIIEMNLDLTGRIVTWAGQFLNPFDARATILTWLIDVGLLAVAFAVVRRLIGLVG